MNKKRLLCCLLLSQTTESFHGIYPVGKNFDSIGPIPTRFENQKPLELCANGALLINCSAFFTTENRLCAEPFFYKPRNCCYKAHIHFSNEYYIDLYICADNKLTIGNGSQLYKFEEANEHINNLYQNYCQSFM
jgi:hypothetical protein